MNKSAIIIGGGLGGLFTGAILAKEGISVTVLEKNATVGGGLQSFRRFGEIFDTGMHVIGGMRQGGNVRRICDYLGITDRLHISDTDPQMSDRVYFSIDGKYYGIAKGRDEYVKGLSESFPDQIENLKTYVDAMYRVVDEVDLFYLRQSSDSVRIHSSDFLMSATDFIAKYISDERLRGIVSYLNPLFGGRGNSTPAYIHALISVLYIEGASRFAGGSYLFAETLKDFITDNGGRVFTGDAVSRVITEGRFISGVMTAGGREFKADYYVCDIHPCTLFPLLDNPSVFPKSYRERLDSIPNSYSAFTLNIKLKPGTFKYFNYSAFYMKDYARMWNFGDVTVDWPLGFLFMTPPALDQGEYATKIIVTAPMLWENVKKWENTYVGHRGQAYEEWKAVCTEKLLVCMEEMHKGFRSCIEEINTASPLTIRDYYGVKEGSMCGFSKDFNNLILSQVPVITKVSNLFLTGQNCNLHGFCGVALTAINTSEAILGRNFVLNKINSKFDDIRPYGDSEIPDAMNRIINNPLFPVLARYIFPDKTVDETKEVVASLRTVRDVQMKVTYCGIKRIIENSMSEFTYDGVDGIEKSRPHLYVSNHRDIMLDAAILQCVLTDNGIETTEITFGANLMQDEFLVDIGKSNKMFRVERPGINAAQFYESSLHLSDYIRTAIMGRKHSVWIANRNGRTKDGKDRTDQGIVKMFGLSSMAGRVESIAELNILPVSVSYEWEPCDILKTLELCAREQGPYVKKKDEDINSIITGIMQYKGRVHFEFCKPLDKDELENCDNSTPNGFYRNVAELLDRRICSAYHLFPNNFIAADMLSGEERYAANYTQEQKKKFIERMSVLDTYAERFGLEKLRRTFLGIYASPVDSKSIFSKGK